MRQRARADNLTICYRKEPNIDVVYVSVLLIYNNFDNVMTKFMINNGTQAWKTDINLLNWTIASFSFCAQVGCGVPLDPGISASTIEHNHVVIETEERFTGKEHFLVI